MGGGFAGLHLIRRLDGKFRSGEVDITLLDQRNYHLFTPLLYQVATGELPEHAVSFPLRLAAVRIGASFVQTAVETIDLEARAVRTADGPFPYDHVVVVPGSVTNDYGIPGVAEHALGMKTLADALAVRRRILDAFERASRETDAARRRQLLTFVIVGAGPVGVELASSLRDLMEHTLRPMYPLIDMHREPEIVLIDGTDRVLPNMPKLSAIAQRRLDRQRVRTVLGSLVAEIRPRTVLTRAGARFDGYTIVWAGGVRTNPLIASLDGVPHGRDGRVVVDPTFRSGERDDVLAFGDGALLEIGGRPLAQLAQVAQLEAPTVARNLVALVRGEPLRAYVHHRKGDLIALGRTHAGAELKRFAGIPLGDGIVLSGLSAWTVWRVNYLMQLLGVRNRATLLAEWTFSYFFSRMVANTP